MRHGLFILSHFIYNVLPLLYTFSSFMFIPHCKYFLSCILFRSGCLAVHRLLTVHHLVKVSIILRVKLRVRARDMVKLKLMDQGDVTVRIRVRIS